MNSVSLSINSNTQILLSPPLIHFRSIFPKMSKKMTSRLILIPSPGKGHLDSTLQFAHNLIKHTSHNQLSITIFILPSFTDTTNSADTQPDKSSSSDQIQYIYLPTLDPPLSLELLQSGFVEFISTYISSYKPHIREAVSDIISSDGVNSLVQLVGIVVDMFCTSMTDVANEFGVPSYVYFTSSAATLGYLYYIQSRYGQDGKHGVDSETELNIPSFVNPVPSSTLATYLLNKNGLDVYFTIARKFRETKGIFVNTFAELEPHAVKSLASLNSEGESYPPVYTVGPIVDLTSVETTSSSVDDRVGTIKKWLDDQPRESVVLLCFGSMGSFRNSLQVKEIAAGLERSGQRFLWSIRKPSQEGTFEPPGDYNSYDEILPPGYLKRVGDRGMICGWIPQVKVLAHPAIGRFVSHCGWNSILESLWFGVPIVTWPLYAEQPNNAFQLVKDLRLAIELKSEYRIDTENVVPADDIETAVTRVLDKDSEVRQRVKEIAELSRRAMSEGGSSFISYGRLLHDMLTDLQ